MVEDVLPIKVVSLETLRVQATQATLMIGWVFIQRQYVSIDALILHHYFFLYLLNLQRRW